MRTEEDLYPLDDDDIDILEEDVYFGEVDGIPSINFSDRIQQLSLKSLDLTLVVKVLGRRPSHSLKLIEIDNDYFLVKFATHSDYLMVLTDGPWTIFGHYLTLEPWSIDFSTSQSIPSRIMAWVRLPITCYKRSLLEAIGSRIGFVVKINFHSDNGSHGKFARMAVKINLRNPLISNFRNPLRLSCPATDLCVDPPADPYGSWIIAPGLLSSRFNPIFNVVEDSPNDAPHDPPLSDDLIRDTHSHITHDIDKSPFGARVEKARITSKVTASSRKSIGISIGSSSFSIPTSRMARTGSSLTHRQPKSKNMGAFLNPKKHNAIRIEADDNHVLPPNSLALVPSSSNINTTSIVTTILKRPMPSSTSHSASHQVLDPIPTTHHVDDRVDMVD
ncbi:hypothetical protein GQ457_10G008500 [Hibiscus cannabinus]